MKYTFWDRVVLYMTGSFPTKTQAKFDAYEAELTAQRNLLILKAKTARDLAAKKAAPSLVKDSATAPTPKKKATPTKKKPSK